MFKMLAFLAFVLFSGPKVDADVVYANVSGKDLMMDVYYPENAPKDPTAAVVVIHGGAWMGGDRKQMGELCQAISKKGLLAATVQYRLAPAFKWPAMLDDVQTAVRYLRANATKYHIDPKRIGATGASAGGHLSLLLGSRDTRDPSPSLFPKESSRVSAVLNLFGPTDLSKDFPPSLDLVFATVLGKPKAQAAEEIRQASPVTFVDAKTAPVFTIHGSADPLVPVIQVQRLHDLLKGASVPNEQHVIQGMGHEIARNNVDCMKALDGGLNWLVKFLEKP